MKLYFLRHAEAIDGVDDALRPLSPHGKTQCRNLGRFLREAGIEFDAVYTSPLVRAHQTAEAVSALTNDRSDAEIQVADELLNEMAFAKFAAWLRRLPSEARHVLLVGHDPSISARVRSLIAIEDEDVFQMPKAALAIVATSDHSTYRLKCFITPKLITST